MNSFRYRLKNKLHETYFIKPNDLGNAFLTKSYKLTTSFLKTMPFLFIIPLACITAFFLYIVFGALIIRLTSLLQYGF